MLRKFLPYILKVSAILFLLSIPNSAQAAGEPAVGRGGAVVAEEPEKAHGVTAVRLVPDQAEVEVIVSNKNEFAARVVVEVDAVGRAAAGREFHREIGRIVHPENAGACTTTVKYEGADAAIAGGDR